MVQYGFVMCKDTLVVMSPSEMDEIAKIGLEAFQTPIEHIWNTCTEVKSMECSI